MSKREFVEQMQAAMRETKGRPMQKKDLVRAMGYQDYCYSSVDRILDPEFMGTKLGLLVKAAQAVGRTLVIRLE